MKTPSNKSCMCCKHYLPYADTGFGYCNWHLRRRLPDVLLAKLDPAEVVTRADWGDTCLCFKRSLGRISSAN